MLNPRTVLQKPIGLRYRDEGDFFTIFNKETSQALELNNTAFDILDQFDPSRSVEEVAALVAKKYEIPYETALQDVTEVVESIVPDLLVPIDNSPALRRKRVYSEGVRFLGVRRRLSAPVQVLWGLTQRCNLYCAHCYSDSASFKTPEFTTEEAYRVLDQLAAAGVFKVIFSGGEPLIHRGFLSIAERAKEKSFNLILSTNATTITKEVAEKLDQLGFAAITVSLDGSKPSVHDAFRGYPTAFERAVKGIENLVKYARNTKITITTVASKFNLADLPNILDLAVKLRVKSWRYIRFMPSGRGLGNKDRLALGPSETRALVNWALTKRRNLAEVIEVVPGEPFIFAADVESDFKVSVPCTWNCGNYSCYISPTGDVYPCHYVYSPEYAAGNIKQKTFAEIWSSPIMTNFAQIYSLDTKCLDCKFYDVCAGGCHAAAWGQIGDITARDPCCFVATNEDPQEPSTQRNLGFDEPAPLPTPETR